MSCGEPGGAGHAATVADRPRPHIAQETQPASPEGLRLALPAGPSLDTARRQVDRQADNGRMGITAESRGRLLWLSDDFDAIVAGAAYPELTAPTHGTRWTNRELLFHMWFGQRITRSLLPLVGAFSRLPPAASRRYSQLLTSASRPYNWVNYVGSAAGGRLVSLERTRRRMRSDTEAIVRWADRASDVDLDRGMSVPPGWDPYFTSWMSRRDVLDWAPKHYSHHRAQLTLRLPGT